MKLDALIEPLVQIARRAGKAILEVYSSDFDVQEKADSSPLTKADMASHAIISRALRELTPDLPQISEESGLPAFELRRSWPLYWLIDPLDGTKEFVKKNGEFTVNIALVEHGRPVLGVVHVPVTDTTYTGCREHGSALRKADHAPQRIEVAAASASPVRVVGSRSHRGASLDAFLQSLGEVEMLPMGSSLKFCVVAEGKADIYPRLGPTSEWDTAAAQAVVEQAGGAVVGLGGQPLAYNTRAEILNPHFLVTGPQDRDWLGILRANS